MGVASKQAFSYVAAVQQKSVARSNLIQSIDAKLPLIVTFERSWPIWAILFQIVGTVLVLSAAGIWVGPGSQMAADLVGIKFGASMFMLFFGVAILMLSHSDNRPDAHFDPIRREVRVLQKCKNGRPKTVMRRGYNTLGSARFTGRTLELFDMDGMVLMRLKVECPETRLALRLHLCDCVNVSI